MHITLENIAEIGLGVATHGRSIAGKGDMKLPLLNVKDIRNGYIDLSDVQSVEVPDLHRVERYRIRNEDIIVTLRGSDFRAAVVKDLQQPVIISANLAAIRLKPNAPISAPALCAWLGSGFAKNTASLLQHKTGILSIAVKDLKNMLVVVPSQPVQKKLEELLESWLTYSRTTEQALEIRRRVFENTVAQEFNKEYA